MAAAYSAAQDFLLVLLPCIIILRLRMKATEKIAIALSMSLGILYVLIIQCFKLIFVSIRRDEAEAHAKRT